MLKLQTVSVYEIVHGNTGNIKSKTIMIYLDMFIILKYFQFNSHVYECFHTFDRSHTNKTHALINEDIT